MGSTGTGTLVTAIEYGLSGDDMLNSLSDILHLDVSLSAVITELLRFINLSQYELYNRFEWPELRVLGASFDTDGSSSYNLTSEISNNFGRVRDKSVRIDTRFLLPKPKSWFDESDPEGNQSGTPRYYDQINREHFILWPFSTGDTVNLDYIRYPVKIDEDTTSAEITFEPARHELILNGAEWRGLKRYGQGDWRVARRECRKNTRDVYFDSKPMKFYPKKLVVSW